MLSRTEVPEIRSERALLPLQRVRVIGPSMVPTLRAGDTVLVVHGVRVRAGNVVLASFRDMPGRLVIKRAARQIDEAWWVESDNPYAGGDSNTHGVADVHARVVLRLSPGLPRRVR